MLLLLAVPLATTGIVSQPANTGKTSSYPASGTIFLVLAAPPASTGPQNAALAYAVGSVTQIANAFKLTVVQVSTPYDPTKATASCKTDRGTVGPHDLLLVLSLAEADQTSNKYTGAYRSTVLLNLTQVYCDASAAAGRDIQLLTLVQAADSGSAVAAQVVAAADPKTASTLSDAEKSTQTAAAQWDAADIIIANAFKSNPTAEQTAAKLSVDAAAQAAHAADAAATAAQKAVGAAPLDAAIKAANLASKAADTATAAVASVTTSTAAFGESAGGEYSSTYWSDPVAGVGAVAALLTSPWVNKYRLWLSVPITVIDSFAHAQSTLNGTIYCATAQALIPILTHQQMIELKPLPVDGNGDPTASPSAQQQLQAYRISASQDFETRVGGVNVCGQQQPVWPGPGNKLLFQYATPSPGAYPTPAPPASPSST
ncbi:MAG TPA: hypothetical protein VKT72_15825 [Candidatus Baltobacteraceae bacterium]|nr:hypothetical protein [Candidatus Baltobacteraceae bacterium]